MKILILLFFFPLISFSQIKIPDVGDGWKQDVENSIEALKLYDTSKYNLFIQNCSEIEFWNGSYSTIDGKNTILISNVDLKRKNINNLSADFFFIYFYLYFKKKKKKKNKKK